MLIEDTWTLLTSSEGIRILDGVPGALERLRANGFQLIVVSNQAVDARGQATEPEVESINRRICEFKVEAGGPRIDAFYFFPHHPKATLPAYRKVCDCRKPEPGMLLRAAREHGIDLKRSFMAGDRMTDIIAGAKAGARTILIQTGQHTAPPIETAEPLDPSIKPDHVCSSLAEASLDIG